jgi:hypothetical protein
MSARDTIFRPSTHQSVAYTATAGTISNAVGAQTRYVRIVVTTAAYYAIGGAPTATTSDVYIPANVPEIIQISPGEKVSAVRVSGDGALHVTELTHG